MMQKNRWTNDFFKRRSEDRRPLNPWQQKSRRRLNHATRAALCAEYGVKNTGRQWVRLRRQLRRIANAVEAR